jgi:hypothetical protein
LERLAAWRLVAGLLKLIGASNFESGYEVPWDKMDLSNPERPSLTCPCTELRSVSRKVAST